MKRLLLPSLLVLFAFPAGVAAQSAAPVANPSMMDWTFSAPDHGGADCTASQTIGNAGLTTFFRTGDQFIVGQSFMAPCDGLVESITITVYEDGTGVTVDPAEGDLVLLEGEGGAGSAIGTQAFSISPPGAPQTFEERTIAFTSDVPVSSGMSYTYVLDTSTPPEFQVIGDNALGYADGIAYGATDGNPASIVPIEGVLTSGDPYDMTFTVTFQPPNVANESGSELPTSVTLGQSYPNPFNPSATIPFEVSETSDVRIAVYDVLGREVAQVVNQTYTPGAYSVSFDALGLQSGTYIYRLEANGGVQMRSMSLLK